MEGDMIKLSAGLDLDVSANCMKLMAGKRPEQTLELTEEEQRDI